MKKLYAIGIGITLLLGVAHTLITPVFYSPFAEDGLWFAGTGLALVFIGLLNLAAYRAKVGWLFSYAVLANGLLAVYLTAVAVAMPAIPSILAVLAAWMMAAGAVFAWIQNKSAIQTVEHI